MMYVYVLRDPRYAKTIRYVGISGDPVRRYGRHLDVRPQDLQTHRGRWIRALLRRGVVPEMEIVCACVNVQRAQLMEMELIAKLREAGFSLTNGTDGGELGTMTRVHKRRTHRRRKATPTRSTTTPHETLFRELVARVTNTSRSVEEEFELIKTEMEHENGPRKTS